MSEIRGDWTQGGLGALSIRTVRAEPGSAPVDRRRPARDRGPWPNQGRLIRRGVIVLMVETSADAGGSPSGVCLT
jgi:hypothetical protein